MYKKNIYISFNAEGDGAGAGSNTGAGAGDETKTKTPVDSGPKYPISQAVKELGYGASINGRNIVVVKDEFKTGPDPITNEPKKIKVANAFVTDSKKEGDPDKKQDYIDDLDDTEFKMLADAGVIILDDAANKRYLKVLQAVTGTKQMPAPK